jgi:hypothetical protein
LGLLGECYSLKCSHPVVQMVPRDSYITVIQIDISVLSSASLSLPPLHTKTMSASSPSATKHEAMSQSSFKLQDQPLSRSLIASIAAILHACGAPGVLWGNQMLTVHGVPTLVAVALSHDNQLANISLTYSMGHLLCGS